MIVDDDAGRRIAIQKHLFPDFLKIDVLGEICLWFMFLVFLKLRNEIIRDRTLYTPLGIKFVFLVQRHEKVAETSDRFRRAEEQDPARIQGIVE